MDQYTIDRIIKNRQWEAEVKDIFGRACAIVDQNGKLDNQAASYSGRYKDDDISITSRTETTPASGGGPVTSLAIFDKSGEEVFSASGYDGYSSGAEITSYMPGRWEDAFNAAAARVAKPTTPAQKAAAEKKFTPEQKRERETWGID